MPPIALTHQELPPFQLIEFACWTAPAVVSLTILLNSVPGTLQDAPTSLMLMSPIINALFRLNAQDMLTQSVATASGLVFLQTLIFTSVTQAPNNVC